jgi:uncharacterized membrane protein
LVLLAEMQIEPAMIIERFYGDALGGKRNVDAGVASHCANDSRIVIGAIRNSP